MSKSELTRACYALDPGRVERLVERGAAVDGSDNEIWRGSAEGCLDGAPYYTPLGEACRSREGGEAAALRIVETLLAAGAPVDGLNYRTETPLHFAAQTGRAAVIRRLIEAGADVNAVGCMGNAVLALMTYFAPDEPGGPKVEALQALLEAGADPRQPDAFDRDLLDQIGDGPLDALKSRRRADKASGRATLELMQIIGDHRPDWEALHDWLARARAARLEGDARARKAQEKIDAVVAALGTPDFEKRARRALGRKAAGRHAELRLWTRGLLMHPAVVADPAWGELVRALLELTVDYGDLTEDVYGERLGLEQMDEDEGGALDDYADEQLSTVELCLLACRAPGAADRGDFADVVRTICETKAARIGAMSFGDDEARALIHHLRAADHPDADALASVARRAFPYADWR